MTLPTLNLENFSESPEAKALEASLAASNWKRGILATHAMFTNYEVAQELRVDLATGATILLARSIEEIQGLSESLRDLIDLTEEEKGQVKQKLEEAQKNG